MSRLRTIAAIPAASWTGAGRTRPGAGRRPGGGRDVL